MVQIGSQKYIKMFECLNWIYGWSPPWLHHQGKENKTHMVDTNLFKSTSRQIEWCLFLQWIFPVVSEYIYIYIQIKLSLIGWSKWLAHVETFNWSSLYTIERFHVYGREWRNINTCEMGESKNKRRGPKFKPEEQNPEWSQRDHKGITKELKTDYFSRYIAVSTMKQWWQPTKITPINLNFFLHWMLGFRVCGSL